MYRLQYELKLREFQYTNSPSLYLAMASLGVTCIQQKRFTCIPSMHTTHVHQHGDQPYNPTSNITINTNK